MGCGRKKCCCDGCSTKPVDRQIGSAQIQPMQQHCCKCIPKVICISSSDDSGETWRSQYALANCNTDDHGLEDPVLYYATLPIDGEVRLVNVRFHVDIPEPNCCASQPLDRVFGTSGFPSFGTRLGTTGTGLTDPEWRQDFNDVFLTFSPAMAYKPADSDPDTGQCYWLWTGNGEGGNGTIFDVTFELKVEQPDHDVAQYNFSLAYTVAISGVPDITDTNTFHYELDGWTLADGTPRLNRVEVTGFGYYGSLSDYLTFPTWIEIGWTDGTPCTATGDACWLTWDIPALGVSGERLIDHEELHDPGPYCENPCQEKTAACCEFGGTWLDVDNAYGNPFSISIAKAPTIPLRDELSCGCCACICQCACLTVYERDNNEAHGGTFTGETNNANRCSELTVEEVTACGGNVLLSRTGSVRWEDYGRGFAVVLRGKEPTGLDSYSVIIGTEVTPTCDVQYLILNVDGYAHEITAASGVAQVEYVLDTRTLQPAYLLELGLWSEDEDSSVLVEVWDWVASDWVTLGSPIDGRPAGYDIPQYAPFNLSDEHTGTGGNEGLVKVRLTTTGATRLLVDMVRVKSPNSCKLYLEVPDDLGTLSGVTGPVEFGELNDCPVPVRGAQWSFTDTTNNFDYIINWECSICNDGCGAQGAGGCCGGAPIPAVLTAEVNLPCPPGSGGCDSPIIIPLVRPFAGSIWTGTVAKCGHSNVTLSLFCESDGMGGLQWSVTFSGIGSCSFSGSTPGNDEDCPPIDLSFSGNYAMGLACCGPSADPMITTIPITIDITE